MNSLGATVRWSKTLFNDVHFLTVANAIAKGPNETSSTELQKLLMLSQPAVHRVLRDLEDVQLLTRLDRQGRTAPQQYRKADHPFWSSAEMLFSTARTMEGSA
ncbi:helix-turn-helix domain-containing protein [Cryobacterium sp. 10S3]|uniref:helix-turn-helix domain-containing protein n=1 Tax=Cryobacterium sp. 10S3 TaxID=3048582 RepID=UPI002AC9E578|nr:helix-turn-helix domain-containing protein [Cryobacterium sp. 10S3]MEB0287489.1 helix-turn-helix domain-containing protein [Cryobacterium sp. 10S3]WPX13287.1 helix-turn-helix domain-containing protein [Cryobacterium sp. 10S3]